MVDSTHYDDIVVGAGIVGLAHAYHLGRIGRRVLVLERSPAASGASVRNFGMIWPVGQPAGEAHDLAMRSRDHWLTILSESGIWHEHCGSLHLAYHKDERQILAEFAAAETGDQHCRTLISAGEALGRSPAVRSDGLLGALWSPTELCVDPRQAVAMLPGWLTAAFGVQFQFGIAATACHTGMVFAGERDWRADRIWLCMGDDLRTLFPNVLEPAGLVPCKLQMMRSQAYGERFRIGPMLAAGLTLAHYGSFRACPTLPALKQRLDREMADYVRYGIHVMASQNGRGEITLGDSHEYGADIAPFDSAEIDRLILDYLATFFQAPALEICSRWHGIYVKHPTKPFVALHPLPGVTIVTGTGGAGMTLSFGIAESVIQEAL